MSKKINEISKNLRNVHEDYRAEVLISEILKNSDLTFQNVLIHNKGTFKRSYRKDLLDIQISENITKDNLLNLFLSRNGIYDALPEGIFHKASKEKNEDYSKFRRKHKHEEIDARLMFSPIENELFHQNVKIEQEEESLLYNFNNLKDSFLINLWKIDTSLPKKYIIKLIKLLPYAHKIAGDLELTFLCLEHLLETTITFKKKFQQVKISLDSISENRLGLDLVLDQDVLEVKQPCIEVRIIPNNKQLIKDFLGEKGILSFVSVFYRYFIPMEYNIKTEIDSTKEEGFILGHKKGTYVGMSTRI